MFFCKFAKCLRKPFSKKIIRWLFLKRPSIHSMKFQKLQRKTCNLQLLRQKIIFHRANHVFLQLFQNVVANVECFLLEQNGFLVTSGFCLLNDTVMSQARGFQLFQCYTNGQLKTGVCVMIHSFYMNTNPRTRIYARVKFREPQNSLRRKQCRPNNKRIGIQLRVLARDL